MDLNVDFATPEAWGPDMPERMRWLRENQPVYWSEKSQFWVLSKYDDVVHVSKNHQIFCSGEGVRPRTPIRFSLIDEDEPRHTRLRRLINRGFTPRMVQRLEDPFREITTTAIDAIARAGECDFVDAISVPLPLLLIAEMMGIRPEDRHNFHRWSDAMIAGDGAQDNPEVMAAAGTAFVEYSTYVSGIIEDRRKSPRDDLISILVGAKDDGQLVEFEPNADLEESGIESELATDELIMLTVILLVAGNETTRNGLSGGMQALIENPDQRQKLLDDPSLIPSAVEEMLRYVSPIHAFSRTTTQDTEIRGQKIEKGQVVLMLYPSANRDADAYDEPDRFLVERNPAHLGFGIGNHFCLGANLARMEMRVAFSELLRRLPDMEFAGDGAEITPAALVRSCKHMRVKYTPEA
jgi:cytochrome P450 family 142 subfamily A polypeptide 1